MNCDPCNGFVKTFAYISAVPKCSVTADRVKNGEAVIEHLGTAEMYANVLTKPLQGSQFIYERQCLTGWVEEAVTK